MENNINNAIGRSLKELRTIRGLTQHEVVKQIGEERISLRSYKTYESGKGSRIPSIEKLALLAEFYSVPIDYLIFNKKCIYEEPFTKRDVLKRLCSLIYSISFIPVKIEDKRNPDNGMFALLSYDREIQLFLSKLETECKFLNYLYEYKEENAFVTLDRLSLLIEEQNNLNDNWYPSKTRFDNQLLECGIKPDDYYKQRMNIIELHREIGRNK